MDLPVAIRVADAPGALTSDPGDSLFTLVLESAATISPSNARIQIDLEGARLQLEHRFTDVDGDGQAGPGDRFEVLEPAVNQLDTRHRGRSTAVYYVESTGPTSQRVLGFSSWLPDPAL